MTMQKFEPTHIRYIKLGPGGEWATQAIADGVVPFGYREIAHKLRLAGDWTAARGMLEAAGRSPTGASQGIREVRDFYELGADTLWVTFAHGHLWWCFADQEVVPLPDEGPLRPARLRRTRDGWHRDSLKGEALSVHSLSSALTRVASYRMTICRIDQADYLLEAAALRAGKGVIAAGNFSITAKLLKQFALEAARHIADFELIDYAAATKPDIPSGTARELAEALASVRKQQTTIPTSGMLGLQAARGAEVGEPNPVQVHGVRLPSYVLAVEAVFALAGERLIVRHEALASAQPYVAGTLLAARKVMGTTGLKRGLEDL